MASSLAQVMADAKSLSFEEREQLIAGLLDDDDAPLSEEWMMEINRRIKEIDDGVAKTIPFEEAMAKLRAELRQSEA